MRSDDDTILERGGGPRLLKAGLGGLLAVAVLSSGAFDGGLAPASARARSAPASATDGPPVRRSSAPVLCFRGPGGEFLDFASAGQRCP